MADEKMMTLEEYNVKMREYAEKIHDLYGSEWDEMYEELSKFQQDYMEKVLSAYQDSIDCKAKEHIYELLSYAVEKSQSGNSIIDVKTEEEADAIDEILWEEIGDYLLEYSIYEEAGKWAIDCMFAGNYVPYWDGWEEE